RHFSHDKLLIQFMNLHRGLDYQCKFVSRPHRNTDPVVECWSTTLKVFDHRVIPMILHLDHVRCQERPILISGDLFSREIRSQCCCASNTKADPSDKCRHHPEPAKENQGGARKPDKPTSLAKHAMPRYAGSRTNE